MRWLSVLAVAVLVGSIGVAHAKVPDIDSSDWAADPVDYGMTAAEYINAEMHAFYAEFIGRPGLTNSRTSRRWRHPTTLGSCRPTSTRCTRSPLSM